MKCEIQPKLGKERVRKKMNWWRWLGGGGLGNSTLLNFFCRVDFNTTSMYPEGIARIVLTDKVRLTFIIWTGYCSVDLFLSDSSRRHSTSSAFHAFRPHQLEPRILQDVLRETFVRAFARQFQPHLGHPYLVVLVLHSIQCPDHIPAEARSLVCFDMVCNSACGCGCNHHHDSCNSHRVFVHPHNLEQYAPHPSITFSPPLTDLDLRSGAQAGDRHRTAQQAGCCFSLILTQTRSSRSPSGCCQVVRDGQRSPRHAWSYGRSYLLHRHCGESAGRRRFPRSHSWYCPVFHLYRCNPAVWNHALRSDVWRPGREQVAQVPRVSNFHGQLSDPPFSSMLEERLQARPELEERQG